MNSKSNIIAKIKRYVELSRGGANNYALALLMTVLIIYLLM
jgi:hypothetical protein